MKFLKNLGGQAIRGGAQNPGGGSQLFNDFFAIFKKNPPAAGHSDNFSQYFAKFSPAAGYVV